MKESIAVSTEQSKSRRVRFQLRTLMLLVAFVGIAAGWLADRKGLNERLRQSEVELQVREQKVETLKQQLSVRYGAIQTAYWWADADEFVKMLTTISDDEEFFDKAPSLAQSEDEVLQDSIDQLTALLHASDERTRLRALITLRFMQELAPDRVAESASSILREVVPLLDDSSTTIVGEAIATVTSFGPAASDAIDPLLKRMSDDSDWYAPSAAVAVSSIDPTIDVGSKLAALVRMKHPNWYQAAFHLPQHVDAETARRVLTKAYDDAVSDEERNMAILAMNQIPSKSESPDESKPK